MADGNHAILNIEGMMCPHCEAHVKQALEALPGVTVRSISHEAKRAEITRPAGVADAALFGAVKDAGYTLLSVE
ncbi:MAG: cation transporter [Oscillospiraceae bacterium]|nr:cation transporter [Oscillospiraceae bacterium]